MNFLNRFRGYDPNILSAITNRAIDKRRTQDNNFLNGIDLNGL